MLISAIISAIENFASPAIQEKWDNSGLQVGSPFAECTGVLVAFDPTPQVVEEAISLGCNLIVTHHPLFFKPVKKLTGTSMVEQCAINAIAAGVSIYSAHTSADSTISGVSYALAQRLGIEPLKVLSALHDRLVMLRAIVEAERDQEIVAALIDAGAEPFARVACTEGTELQMTLAPEQIGRVESVLREVAQEAAYSFSPMLNTQQQMGLGIYGISEAGYTPTEFVEHVKAALGCKAVRTSKVDFPADTKIRRVALCGGAGGEFIGKAIAMGAQAIVTADVRYHDFVDYRDQILIIDAGHYETEAPIKEVFAKVISDHFPTVPVHITNTIDNPINYL